VRKGLKTFGCRTGLIGLDLLAVTLCLAMLAAGLMLWRLAAGPVNLTFARDTIERALYDPATGTDVRMGDVFLSWPRFAGPLELTLKNVSLSRQQREMVGIDEIALDLSTKHLLIGHIEPLTIVFHHPIVNIVRDSNNHLQIGSLGTSTPQAAAANPAVNPLADLIARLTGPKEKGRRRSPLASLKTLRIDDASVVLEDHYAGRTWYLQHVGFRFGRDAQGLAIAASLKMPGGLHGQSALTLDALYGREHGDIRFNLQMQDFDLASGAGKLKQLDFLTGQSFIVDGNLSGRLDKTMALQSLSLELAGQTGALDLPGVYNEPLPYSNLNIKASYDAAAGKGRIDNLQFTTKGVTLMASSDVALSPNAVKAAVTIRIPELQQAEVGPLWPDVLRGEGSEAWLVHKLSDGMAKNFVANFDVMAQRAPALYGPPSPDGKTPEQKPWSVAIQNLASAFDILGMTVDYRAPLTPLKNAFGHAVYKGNDLSIEVVSGTVGGLKAGASHILLQNVAHAHLGTAFIDVNASGPLQSVFRYTSDEPIGLGADQLHLDLDKVQGTADLAIHVSFPMIKDMRADQVKVTVQGMMQNVLLPKIVSGMDLSGGPFKLEVADAAATLSGAGKLAGRAITFTWQHYLHPEGKPFMSKTNASLVADDGLRTQLGVDLGNWIIGAMPVTIVSTEMPDKTGTVDVKADLTPGTVNIEAMDYTKPAGTAGSLQCTVSLVDGKVAKVAGLQARTPDLALDNGQLLFSLGLGKNHLQSGSFPSAKLGDTNLALDFSIGDDGHLTLDGKGAFLDATPFLKRQNTPQDGNPEPALTANIAVDRMRTGLKRTLSKVVLNFERGADGLPASLDLNALTNGVPVDFRLKPDADGRQTMHLEADNAGEVLRAFNIYDNVDGGKLIIDGRAPNPGDKSIVTGHAAITDFRVVNAPVLAQLLNAVSLTSIPRLLTGPGIHFSRLQANFEWDMRRDGDLYIIRDGRTSGASLGLTFAGSVDKRKNYTNLDGTIIPLSGLNGLLNNIPLIGPVLSGNGALFAFTYNIKGPSANPAISVNPLSALAPGFLRKILFEGNDEQ
jgi:hypothetical protein